MAAWQVVVTEWPYFPEHSTQDERDFQATEDYVLCFYRWDPFASGDLSDSPQLEGATPTEEPSTPSMVVQAELTSLRTERDRLRWEIAEKDEQLIDQRQLQKELAQACAKLQRSNWELARANAALERSRKRARGATTHVYATDESCPPSWVDHPRFSPLHGETCREYRPSIPATHLARQSMAQPIPRESHFHGRTSDQRMGFTYLSPSPPTKHWDNTRTLP
ncbi:hypothetical protein CRG98_034325 [Punica granatum]|uniref:Uncharacterized protein n=1 Tax=Punica granatum TaxID=22663 RepID=A0A2I0IMQ4_PUNGR|nr:hypothetical protein CRG98_034325 [Punica granatum]